MKMLTSPPASCFKIWNTARKSELFGFQSIELLVHIKKKPVTDLCLNAEVEQCSSKLNNTDLFSRERTDSGFCFLNVDVAYVGLIILMTRAGIFAYMKYKRRQDREDKIFTRLSTNFNIVTKQINLVVLDL